MWYTVSSFLSRFIARSRFRHEHWIRGDLLTSYVVDVELWKEHFVSSFGIDMNEVL